MRWPCWDSPAEAIVTQHANQRCRQENLIEQHQKRRPRAEGSAGQSGKQLGVHGDGFSGVESQSMDLRCCLPATGRWQKRREAEKQKTVGNGVRNVSSSNDQHSSTNRPQRSAFDLPVVVMKHLAGKPSFVSGISSSARYVANAAQPEAGVRRFRSAATP